MPTAVTIIVPTCNREEELAACLRLLVPQIPRDGSAEIVICDDGVAMGTRDVLLRDYPSAIRVSGPRRGPGANRNTGAKSARGEWLVFLDDDVLPRPAFLAGYLAAIADPRMAGGVLAGATFRSGENKGSLLWESPHFDGPGVLPPSCNFAIPRTVFEASGGFDERFCHSFEDMEFFARLKLSGVPVHFLEAAAVDHPVRPLPPSRVLARRWESRVISAYDSGAGSLELLWRLPRHVLLVILSRFRGRSMSAESIRAAAVFAGEFFVVLACLPGWVMRFRDAPRSAFWAEQVKKGNRPSRFGL
ncbi:MAG: glycosyltransferase family A protein [Terrimicrobiaceae bacterium]